MHWIIFAMILLLPATALANVAIPTIFVSLPLQIFALGPVIFIEAWVIYRALHEGEFRDVLYTTTKANFLTTILGTPVTWFLVVLVNSGGFYTYEYFRHGWISNAPIAKIIEIPLALMNFWGEVGTGYHWAYPVSLALLLIPFYIMSWRIEYFVFKRSWKEVAPDVLKCSVRNANRLSYGVLFIGLLVWMLSEIGHR